MSNHAEKAGEFYRALDKAALYGRLELRLLLQVYILSNGRRTNAWGETVNQISMTDHAKLFGVTLPAVSRCVVALEARKLITRVRIFAQARNTKRAGTFIELQTTPKGNREVRRILGVSEGETK